MVKYVPGRSRSAVALMRRNVGAVVPSVLDGRPSASTSSMREVWNSMICTNPAMTAPSTAVVSDADHGRPGAVPAQLFLRRQQHLDGPALVHRPVRFGRVF